MKTFGTLITIAIIAIFTIKNEQPINNNFKLIVDSNQYISNNLQDTLYCKIDSLEQDIKEVKNLEKELGIK